MVCGRLIYLEGVEKALKEMEGQPHIVMDWNTYAVVADLYIKAGQTNKAINALKMSEERLDTENGHGYNFLISRTLCEYGEQG